MTERERDEPTPARKARASVRTCVGCQGEIVVGQSAEDDASGADLHVRVVLGPTEGERTEVAVDFAGTSFGRGAHVHLRPACLEKACRGGFARAFRRPVVARVEDLARQVTVGADQKIRGLLMGARRAKLLAFGDSARDAMASGKADLAVVAVDAGASATKGALKDAVLSGRAIAYGSKAELGALFGTEEAAVVAICHANVAFQVHCARRAADAVSGLVKASG